MSMTLKEQAWQSGLVLLDETAEWNETNWPPLEGGWRDKHASVVVDHPNKDKDNNKRQTVVVLGGRQRCQGVVNSVLVLNLAESNKQWREAPAMNKSRRGHAAVVCNGSIYVMGGCNGEGGNNGEGGYLDCMERIDSTDLLQSFFTTTTTQEGYWTTLKCRLSPGRYGCCAVAVHNRYIVVMGGRARGSILSLVDILDTSDHTVMKAPSMKVPRLWHASAVVGHRIFVGGGYVEESVEYLEFAKTCGENTEKDDKVFSFSSTWRTHSDMVLSDEGRYACAVVAVGS